MGDVTGSCTIRRGPEESIAFELRASGVRSVPTSAGERTEKPSVELRGSIQMDAGADLLGRLEAEGVLSIEVVEVGEATFTPTDGEPRTIPSRATTSWRGEIGIDLTLRSED